MAFRCYSIFSSSLLIISGVALAVLLVVFWSQLENSTNELQSGQEISHEQQNDSLNFNLSQAVARRDIFFNERWIFPLVSCSTGVTICCGIIGFIAGLQQGQCITLTYMVSSVLSLFTSICTLIGSSFLLAKHCPKSFTSCIEDTRRIPGVLFLFLLVLVCLLVMVVSSMASCVTCRARCYCCGTISRRNRGNIHNHDNMAAMSTI